MMNFGWKMGVKDQTTMRGFWLVACLTIFHFLVPFSVSRAFQMRLEPGWPEGTDLQVGDEFQVTVSVSWEEGDDLLQVGTIEAPASDRLRFLGGRSVMTVDDQGRQLLEQTFAYRAEETGDVELGPVGASYESTEGGVLGELTTGSLFFEVRDAPEPLLPTKLLLKSTGGFGLFLLLIACTLVWVRRRKKRESDRGESLRPREEAFQRMVRCRIEGDWSGHGEAVGKLVEQMPEEDLLRTEIDDYVEAVRFAGKRPTTEEVQRIEAQLKDYFNARG